MSHHNPGKTKAAARGGSRTGNRAARSDDGDNDAAHPNSPGNLPAAKERAVLASATAILKACLSGDPVENWNLSGWFYTPLLKRWDFYYMRKSSRWPDDTKNFWIYEKEIEETQKWLKSVEEYVRRS